MEKIKQRIINKAGGNIYVMNGSKTGMRNQHPLGEIFGHVLVRGQLEHLWFFASWFLKIYL